MTVRKAIHLTLVLPVITLCIISALALFGQNGWDSFILIFLVLIFGLWVIGLLIGVVLSAIFKSPNKEPYFYIGGHLAIIITIASFFIINSYEKKQHKKQFGNVETNLSTVRFFNDYPNVDSVPIKALQKLESTFSNPNDFKIESFFQYRKDTVIDNFMDSLRVINFTYTQYNDPELLFSKITILDNVARLDIVGEKASSSSEYANMLKRKNKVEKEAQKAWEEMSKQLTDSAKEALKKDLKKK